LYLPKGERKYEKLDYWTTDLAGLLKELQAENFTGYLEILSTQQHGLFIFHEGAVYNCFYDGTEDLQLTPLQIIEYFLQKKKRGPETIISVSAIAPQIVSCLSALEIRPPLYRELETSFLDMDKLFETLEGKHFKGLLRFYHIRSHNRLGNILIKMNKITREQLQDAVRLQLSQKGSLRLGDVLVQSGAIDAQDLDSALNLQSHARKGSNVEIAIALFDQGRFIGGYSHMHKQFNRTRDQILPELVGTEVLMDIVAGGLPDAIDLHPILYKNKEVVVEQPSEKSSEIAESVPAAPPAESDPHPAARPSKSVVPEAAESAMVLRGEDLVLLDLSQDWPGQENIEPNVEVAEASETPAPEPETPELMPEPIPAAESEPEPVAVVVADSVSPAEPEPQSYWISDELTGLDYVEAVAEKFMGPLGKSLVGREVKALGFLGREWMPTQLQELSRRVEKASSLILGANQARKLADKLGERLPGA